MATSSVYCFLAVISILLFAHSIEPLKVALQQSPVNNAPCLNPQNVCFNGGTCLGHSGNNSRFSCLCPTGFSGLKCEISTKIPCTVNICQNGGACFQHDKSTAECVCPTGFEGEHCEIAADDDTCTITCPSDSICVNNECECAPGSRGTPSSCVQDPCTRKPCLNGATCIPVLAQFTCSCPPGFSGNFCQISPTSSDDLCKSVQCPPNQKCISQGEIVSCVPLEVQTTLKPLNIVPSRFLLNTSASAAPNLRKHVQTTPFPLAHSNSLCPPQTCFNGGSCTVVGNNLVCKCRAGFTGDQCENDIDECVTLKPCQHGVCQNQHGSYQCYCRPGYMGLNCSDDFDECYSNPCKNAGSCMNTIGGYECICASKFTGPHCELNSTQSQNHVRPQFASGAAISPEFCSNKTCFNGGTCIDSLIGFQCVCPPGFTGLRCNVSLLTTVDPCAKNPCATGRCLPSTTEAAGYSCECDGGISGQLHCDSPADEIDCNTIGCLNNGSCDPTSGTCKCSYGFTGPKCETAKRASTGCTALESGQCLNGASCIEAFSSFVCLCQIGYTGRHCETKVDECLKNPTVCGSNSIKCVSSLTSFKCICKEGYTGLLCNVSESQCDKSLCKTNQKCKSSLDENGTERRSCECEDGYIGESCSDSTVASFDGAGLLAYVATNSNPSSYSLSFQFRTTLANVVLVTADTLVGNSFTVFLKNGRLHCQCPSDNSETTIDTLINDGHWYEVFLLLNATHSTVGLKMSGAQLGLRYTSLSKQLVPVFTTKIGGPMMPNLVDRDFSGCMQNINVNGNQLIPKAFKSSSINVQYECTRQEQCKVDSCSGNGRCVDMWSTFECECKRPYLPPSCAVALPESTFGYGTNRSFAQVSMNSNEKELLTKFVDVSMIIVTRATDGALVYIGSEANEDNQADLFFSVQLENGRLKVAVQLGQQSPTSFFGGPMLNDGKSHLIRVVRNESIVDGYVNGDKVFEGRLPGRYLHPLFADYFLIGGFPESSEKRHKQPAAVSEGVRNKRAAEPILISPLAYSSPRTFKGTIQDPRVNEMLIMLSAQLNISHDMNVFGKTELRNHVLAGTVSDDTCQSKPCLNSGVCSITFNDFNCSCSSGWRGRTCSKQDYCLTNPCPKDATCKNLEPDGFTCLGEVTLKNDSVARFSMINVNVSDSFSTLSFKMRTRDRNGRILYVGQENGVGSFLSVELINGGLYVAFTQDAKVVETMNATGAFSLIDGMWHKISFTYNEQPYLTVDNETNIFLVNGEAHTLLSGIFANADSKLIIGSVSSTQFKSKQMTSFVGCLNDVIFGVESDQHTGYPVSFYKTSQSAKFPFQQFSMIDIGHVEYKCMGDPVCDGTCKNGATCVDLFNEFRCDCPVGFKGKKCEINIDDCVNEQCQNNATCVDGVASYTCACLPGTTGRFCEVDIDECASAPCSNGGTCSDLRNGFMCTCGEDYTGKHCEFSLLVDCASNPCLHHGSCSDVKLGHKKSFNCTCHPSYFGQFCESEVDFCLVTPCHNNGTCQSLAEKQDVVCKCPLGFEGKLCEIDIDDCQAHPCINGQCVDGIANFTCTCSKGWRGFICNEDIDECLSSPCSANSTCNNTPGNFTCKCQEYYLGETCSVEGSCLKSPCLRGKCEQLTAVDFRCQCPNGYTGKTCDSEINYCESTPCLNGGNCSRLLGGYNCLCRPGYTGVNCEININECASNPCQNNGVCVDDVAKFMCRCNGTGYEGDVCQLDVDECSHDGYCYEGFCRNLIGTYNCTCHIGYIGSKCNYKDPCTSSNVTLKCQNGGKCHNPRVLDSENKVDYDCQCSESFFGELCGTPKQSLTSDGPPLVYIIAPIVGFVLLVCLIACLTFVMVARSKRATRGTYSPSRQEMTGARVQMGAMMKPPPEERLI